MPWQYIRISRFGGPEVLELAEQPTLPEPGPDEVRIKVLAAGTGFTDTFIRRGRYPDFKGPLPFTPGYDLVGVVEQTGRGVTELRPGQVVADLCVIGGYAQYAIRPARFLVPDGVDPTKAVCIPLATILVIGDWHLLGCEPGCGRALRCNRDRLSRRRLRHGRALAHRKPQGWRWRRCRL